MSRKIPETVNTSVDIPASKVREYCNNIIDKLIQLSSELHEIKNPSKNMQANIDATLKNIADINEKLVPLSRMATDFLAHENKDSIVDKVRNLVDDARGKILDSESGLKEIQMEVEEIKVALFEQSDTTETVSNISQLQASSTLSNIEEDIELQSIEKPSTEEHLARNFSGFRSSSDSERDQVSRTAAKKDSFFSRLFSSEKKESTEQDTPTASGPKRK